jgi:hypothetical protein
VDGGNQQVQRGVDRARTTQGQAAPAVGPVRFSEGYSISGSGNGNRPCLSGMTGQDRLPARISG